MLVVQSCQEVPHPCLRHCVRGCVHMITRLTHSCRSNAHPSSHLGCSGRVYGSQRYRVQSHFGNRRCRPERGLPYDEDGASIQELHPSESFSYTAHAISDITLDERSYVLHCTRRRGRPVYSTLETSNDRCRLSYTC